MTPLKPQKSKSHQNGIQTPKNKNLYRSGHLR
uniref:Uncharacterized protein n=1 Tax=Anguilla anguilla TaxID=7936 RepID=A0A0E9Q7J1_ANGAN